MTAPSLIESIYEAALRPAGWQSVVIEMAELLNARDACFATYNFETHAYAADSLPIDPEYARRYDEQWAHRNFLWQATCALPVGTLFSFDTAMPRDQFEKTEFFNEWWLPQQMTKTLGANLITTKSLSSVATFHRPPHRPDFGRDDMERFRAVLPHLARAMEVRHQLETCAGMAEDFRAWLEALNKPALLVDPDCRLQFANAAAYTLLRSGDLAGSATSPLAAGRADQTRALRAVVGDLFHGGGAGGPIGLHRSEGRPLTLTIYRLHPSASPFTRPSALILIDDPESDLMRTGSASLLQSLYRLTKSEVQLVLLIASGMRLQQAAEERGISLPTAKTHLSHIFQKMGVTSQGELIRLLIMSGVFSASGGLI